MRRILSAVAILVFFASCHGDGVGMEWDATGASPDVTLEIQLEHLNVRWTHVEGAAWSGSGVFPVGLFARQVSVDSGRTITASIETEGPDGTVSQFCTGSAHLSDSAYSRILKRIASAELMEYEPPSVDECESVDSISEIVEIEFRGGGKVVVASEDEDLCGLSREIHDLARQVESLAISFVEDCSWVSDGAVVPEESASKDSDGDCIPDVVEAESGTLPYSQDTDGDGLPDGWVEETGMGEDINCNGMVDVDEEGRFLETDPRFGDSDIDGISDWDETWYCCTAEIEEK